MLNRPCNILLNDHSLTVVTCDAVRILRFYVTGRYSVISSAPVPCTDGLQVHIIGYPDISAGFPGKPKATILLCCCTGGCSCRLGLIPLNRKMSLLIGALESGSGGGKMSAGTELVTGIVGVFFQVEGAVVSGKTRDEAAQGGYCGGNNREV